jgi:hypothetical protein
MFAAHLKAKDKCSNRNNFWKLKSIKIININDLVFKEEKRDGEAKMNSIYIWKLLVIYNMRFQIVIFQLSWERFKRDGMENR